MTAIQAIGDLRAVDLTNSIDNLNRPESFENGKAIGQNPPAGFHAALDSRVNLQISCAGHDTPAATALPEYFPTGNSSELESRGCVLPTICSDRGVQRSMADRALASVHAHQCADIR